MEIDPPARPHDPADREERAQPRPPEEEGFPGADHDRSPSPGRSSSARLPFGRGDGPGLHHALEVPEIFANLLARRLAEQPGNPHAELAPGWIVLQHHADLGPAIPGLFEEVDRARR